MIRGRLTKKVRDLITSKYQNKCAYCGIESSILVIDHIKPVAHGGTDSLDNLNPSCFSCNNYKNTMTLEVFRDEVSTQVDKARKYSVNFRIAERYGHIKVIKTDVIFYFELLKDNNSTPLSTDNKEG